jgi:hypothetical protein
MYVGFGVPGGHWNTKFIEASTPEEAEEKLLERLDREGVEHVSFVGVYHEGDIIEDGEDDEDEDWSAYCDYELSDNQKQFVRDAEEQGLEINWDYSGRGMFGKCCPAVMVDGLGEFHTTANYESDSMGLGFVIYAR